MNIPTDPSQRRSLRQLARQRLLERRHQGSPSDDPLPTTAESASAVPERWRRFDQHPGYERLVVAQTAARRIGVANPFFRVHEGTAGAQTRIGERDYLNFSSYDYLGLNADSRVHSAAAAAIGRYGVSPSASRLVAGERPIQRELEQALAEFYGVEDCVAFVSGHATNVSTIASLFGPKDLVLHDALAHNSIIEGIKLSGAHRRTFPHNDWRALDALLGRLRGNFERALIVIEGIYSMDGDVPELPRFVELKARHGTFLMVDEAHALGVLGGGGRGIAEHFNWTTRDVDIWMGTLSKSLASGGGYIAGSHVLIELLKYTAPGFVYSVGLSPPLAAAALAALRILQTEPKRVARVQANGQFFLNYAKKKRLPTGLAEGHAIVPIIIGSSLKATQLSNRLFDAGINVQPILHPAVEERAARLRFFIGATHEEAQMRAAVDEVAQLI